MELKPGYKQTEAGVIPKDWDVAPLGKMLLKAPDYGINAASIPFDSRSPRYLRITDIDETGRIDASVAASVDHHDSACYLLAPGDVVLARTGASVGKSYLYRQQDGPLVFAGFLIRCTPDPACLLPRYLSFFLQSSPFWEWVRVHSMRSGQPGINGREYASLPVPVPPTKAEQEAIAAALSDADALIESLERLIAKKRLIKQGAMQELLTGKRRLPGFSGGWRSCRWGDVVAHCSSGGTPYRGNAEFYRGPVKWITSSELNYNVIEDSDEHISEEAMVRANLRLHPKGTFLMAITGLEAEGTRGACGIVGSPATTNQSCMAIYPTGELTTQYLFHYYLLRGNELALEYCQGTKQQSYTAGLVRLLPIRMPISTDEQIAITDVLNDMNAELTALNNKLDKARKIKQGMMQELLTGKTRLV